MEKGNISARQMVLLMYPAILSIPILSLPAITAKYAKNDLWMSPIIASLVGFAAVYIAYKLHQLYPKLTVIEYSEQIAGKFIGKIVGLIFILFYIQTTGHTVRAYADFIVESFLIKTPTSVVMGCMIFVCAVSVRAGIEVLGRTALVFFPVFVIPLLVLTLLALHDFDFKNFYPLLGDGFLPPLKGAIPNSVWFSEFFIIAFLLPFLSDETKGKKYGMISVVLVTFTLVFIHGLVLFMLGPTTPYKVYPVMNIARYISVSNFFEHLESIVMAIWIAGTFVKISLFYYACSLGIAQWLKLSSYKSIVWPLGIMIIIIGFWSLPSTMALIRFEIETLPFLGATVQILIPLLLLLIAYVRKRKRK